MRGGWTNEQLEAINSTGENLLVSAAAGSGKTAVLIERIIRIITGGGSDGADIDELLVVTFTKAAASEMKGRLMERLSDMQRNDRENKALQKQAALLPRASISTFDALCQKIVKENFVASDIDPSFKVGDDEELHLLRMQALDDVFEEHYEEADFRALVESVCERADDFELRDTVLTVFDFIQSERTPLEWLLEKAEGYNINAVNCIDDTFYAKTAFEYAKEDLKAAYSLMKKGTAAISVPGGPIEYGKRFFAETEMIKRALSAQSYSEMAEAVKNIVFDRLPGVRGGDETLKDSAKEWRGAAKKSAESVKENYFFKDERGLLADINGAYPVLKTLSRIVTDFSERYMELKKERRILSFSDIKLLCYEALVKDGEYTEAAKQYQSRFKYVLVDEYQDTNDVEEGILDAVSGGGEKAARFMVGDVKQSIYRFRRSKPELFIEKSEEYSEQSGGRLITLYKNFRSGVHILSAVNLIFSQIMSKKAAEIEYDENAALVSGRPLDEASGTVKITLIETDGPEPDGSENDSDTLNELKALEVEALYVADEIYRLVSEENVKLDDIVILMRSGKRNGALFSDALSRKGLPSFTEGKTGFFEMTEISDMLALLNIIDNPLQDIPLITTLTSPVFKFSADELIEIRGADKGSFYNALSKYTDISPATALSEKASDFLRRLLNYRRLAPSMAVGELLSYLYDDTNYYIIAGAMENGALRQANLRDLLRRASDFEKSSFPGLFHFVRYMERLKETDSIGQAELSSGGAYGAVRIMTIHKSKGLEFPVVFLSGCGSKFNLRDLNEKFVLHQELGYGAVYVDYESRVKSGTLPRSVVKERLRREALAEEMRLLYVAMTRAKEHLYITGNAGKDALKRVTTWLGTALCKEAVFPPETVLGAATYMDWIMPSVFRSESAALFLDDFGLQPPPVINVYSNKSAFEIKIAKRSEATLTENNDVKLTKEQFERKIAEITEGLDGAIKNDIDKMFNWKYNYDADVKQPVKLSVSEIKTQYQRIIAGESETGLSDLLPSDDNETTLKKPDFLREVKSLSPSEKGTAVHSVLARIDFQSGASDEYVLRVMDVLLDKKILNKKEHDSINIPDITAFLKSETAERIRRSGSIRREVPFVIGISAEEAYLPHSDETILVHGIIDCFFEENGKIVIIDYKTDYVKDGDFENVKQKYKIQLDIYKKAAGLITQKPVVNAYLYMMRYGRLIDMSL